MQKSVAKAVAIKKSKIIKSCLVLVFVILAGLLLSAVPTAAVWQKIGQAGLVSMFVNGTIELNTLHSQGIELVEPADLSGSLKGRHNLYNHLELTIRNAEESVSIMTTSQGLLRKIEGFKPTFEKLKKRGVKIRIAAPLTKETVAAVKDIGGVAEIRNVDTKARFVIVDGKEVIFMIMDDTSVHPTYDVGIWVNTPFFSSALENLYNTAWKGMKSANEVLKKR